MLEETADLRRIEEVSDRLHHFADTFNDPNAEALHVVSESQWLCFGGVGEGQWESIAIQRRDPAHVDAERGDHGHGDPIGKQGPGKFTHLRLLPPRHHNPPQ